MRIAARSQTQDGGLKPATFVGNELQLALFGGKTGRVQPACLPRGSGGKKAFQLLGENGMQNDWLFGAHILGGCEHAQHRHLSGSLAGSPPYRNGKTAPQS